MNDQRFPLIVIVGETASGKTALGIELAQKFDGEIICADSRTVYKHMDIGTAKPTKAEQRRVRHHLIDLVEPNEKYNAARFKKDALAAIANISGRGKVPIMVGGTGLYIDAVIFDYDFDSKTMSELLPNTLVIGIKRDRDDLKERISKRVDEMVAAGLVEEIKDVANKYGWQNEAMKSTSYRAFEQYIKGVISLEEAKRQFIRNDILFAKRQRTWFKRNKSIHWVNNSVDAVELATTFLSKFSN